MSSVLVVGSMAYDDIETSIGKADKVLGGSAMYFSAAASFFSPVQVVAVVGDDFNHPDLDFLKTRGVDFNGLQNEPGKTFAWGGKYSDDFTQRETLYTHLNVFEHFKPQVPDSFRKTRFVFLANIGPELQLNVLSQMTGPEFIALDTMNYWIDRTLGQLLDVISRVHCLIINDEEARQLTGEKNLIKAILKIRKMGPKVLIVKKGENGSMMLMDDEFFFLPAFPVEALVDPTGAGDTFAGGFMGYLGYSDHKSKIAIRNAVVFGSSLASYCVEGFGPQRLMDISKDDIFERYRRFQRLTQFEFSE